MRRHLLVTNDFPPKVGGIQSYLWELWRRLPIEDFSVYTTPQNGDEHFDRTQGFVVKRSPEPVLLPYPWLPNRISKLAEEIGAELVIWDPAVPLGLSALRTKIPYAVVLHGAEVTAPGRLPAVRRSLARVLDKASLLICAGKYPATEAQRIVGRPLPTEVIPPGVDIQRFVPLADAERAAARKEFGLPADAALVVALTRLVPRKGMDTLIRAAGKLRSRIPDLVVAIAGSGRDERRLRGIAERSKATVRLLGRVSDELLPGFLGAGDVFAMPCRSRWGGLEQEGFGIVFLEAAAAGIPQVGGRTGGAAEAVLHGETGLVVDLPESPEWVADAIEDLFSDDARRRRMGSAARKRVEQDFSYDVIATRLRSAIDGARLG